MMQHNYLNSLPNPDFDQSQHQINEIVRLSRYPDMVAYEFKVTASGTTPEMLTEIAYRLRESHRQFWQMTFSITRKQRISMLVAATAWKADVQKQDSLLQRLLSDRGIAVAQNTDAEQATNAAILRYLTETEMDDAFHKSDISRNAKAITGIEILCQDNGLAVELANNGKILDLVGSSSRDLLIKLANDRRDFQEPVNVSVPANALKPSHHGFASIDDTVSLEQEQCTDAVIATAAPAIASTLNSLSFPDRIDKDIARVNRSDPDFPETDGIYLMKMIDGQPVDCRTIFSSSHASAAFEELSGS